MAVPVGPFRLFIGDKEILPNITLSIAEAAQPLKTQWLPEKLRPVVTSHFLVNIDKDELYYHTVESQELGPDGLYHTVYHGGDGPYTYKNYPTDSGTYVYFVFNSSQIRYAMQSEILGEDRKNFIRIQVPKLNLLGTLLGRIQFRVQAGKTVYLPGYMTLPRDIQSYIIVQNFNIYEILDFCASYPAIAKNEGLWQDLAKARLTRRTDYPATKDQVIQDLKRVEYILILDQAQKRYPDTTLIDFELALQKLREYMKFPIVSHLHTRSLWVLGPSFFVKLVIAYFPTLIERSEKWTVDDTIQIFRDIISQLNRKEFEYNYNDVRTRFEIGVEIGVFSEDEAKLLHLFEEQAKIN